LITSCSVVQEETLPPAKQEGKNTFRCLVDGEVFVASREGVNLAKIGVTFEYPNHFGVLGRGYLSRYEDDDEAASVYFRMIDSTVTIGRDKIYLSEQIRKQGGLFKCLSEYWTFGETSGSLKINKLDTLNKIIAGAFWFYARSEEGEIVEVREGRFDVKYIPSRN